MKKSESTPPLKMRIFDKVIPLKMICSVCGIEDSRIESYHLEYKLAGQYTHHRRDICTTCWADKKCSKIVDAMFKIGPYEKVVVESK